VRIERTRDGLRAWLDGLPGGGGMRVLVPTMGALHRGHLALIARGRALAGPEGTLVVSIFVNPLQFDRAEDLAGYPRPEERDEALCREAGVDVLFLPPAGEMYASDHSVTVSERALSLGLCGAVRPGHFDGVCTVVLKLFLLTGCRVAVFGEKDFQQLAVVRRMVRDLDVPVEIDAFPTVREEDGLALSSRNQRLDAARRADAPRIRRALLEAARLSDPAEMLRLVRTRLGESPLLRVDYVEVVDAATLRPVEDLRGAALLAVAVFYGEVRLIDHIAVGPRRE
jgi:pantoate--beta-alanine ligase